MSTPDYPDWQDPGAIAAAIATGNPGGAPGGVPLLHGQSSLSSQPLANLIHGASVTATLGHINIGYELLVGFQGNTINPNAQCTAELLFQDVATGDTVDRVAYVFWPSDLAAGSMQQVYGKGPTRGNQVTLRIINQGGIGTLFYQYLLTQSGRIYAYDSMRPFNSPASASGRNVPSSDPEAGILAAHFVSTLGIGASQVDQLPPFMGKAHIHFDSASSAADCEVNISAADDSLFALSSGIVYDQFTDGTGNRDADIVLPGVQCIMTITNHNAAAKNVRYIITETPY